MTKATRTTRVAAKIRAVTLELTAGEAGVLLELMYAISGPQKGPRSVTDSVLVALEGVGIKRHGRASGAIDLQGPPPEPTQDA